MTASDKNSILLLKSIWVSDAIMSRQSEQKSHVHRGIVEKQIRHLEWAN